MGSHQLVSMGQNILAINLVIKQAKAAVRRLLLLCYTAFSEASGCLLVFPGSSPITFPLLLQKHSELRVLPSTGIARLRRYFDPIRRPDRPPSMDGVGGASSTNPGPPSITRPTFYACRAHYSRRIEQVLIGFFPVRTAFPVSVTGRHPRLHFRGLLKLHSRYGLHTVAHPPFVGFIARLRPSRLPG